MVSARLFEKRREAGAVRRESACCSGLPTPIQTVELVAGLKSRFLSGLPVILICLSLTALVTGSVLVAGIENTGYATVDSQGHAMGFNDPLTREHYGIILRNFRPANLINVRFRFEWAFLTVQLIGACFVFSKSLANRAARVFFGAQLLLLPVAFLGGLVLSDDLPALLTGTMDREGFTDIPCWGVLISMPIWCAGSFAAFWFSKRPTAESPP
jgi:hypothetical protein